MNWKGELKFGNLRIYWSYLFAFATLLLFISLQNAANWGDITPKLYTNFGAPYAQEIFDGAIWGIVTNSFVHKELWHVLLSVSLFVFLGILFEIRNKPLFFLLFVVISSFVTSSLQLAMSGDPGIGLNGVNFALFTYLMVRIKVGPRYKRWKILVWLAEITALILSILNMYYDWYYFGTFTVVTGFLFGLIVGLSQDRKVLFYASQAIIWAICLTTLIYNPYSSEWNTVQGYHAFKKGDIDKAEEFYLRALELHPRNYAAKKNLVLIEIDRLETRAFYAHQHENYVTARHLYIQILNLDKDNEWAKRNLQGLP